MALIRWIGYEIKWFFIRGFHFVFRKWFINNKKYGSCKLLNAEDGNKYMIEKISKDEPFAFCRCSFSEMRLLIKIQREHLFHKPHKKGYEDMSCLIVNNESIQEAEYNYYKLMADSTINADLIGIWKLLPMADAVIGTLPGIKGTVTASAECVEPYYYDIPWTSALKGKKVLIVSPFSAEVKHQYAVREKLWPTDDILPEFNLDTEDSIWYFDGHRDPRFANWFEVYDTLYENIMKHDFDIALLGCGMFGFPLAARIKKAGKQAVHVGGAIQILFGIKGSRWDGMPEVNKYYNEYWIRPGELSKPDAGDMLDGGCYW